jgi:hypothetical protein
VIRAYGNQKEGKELADIWHAANKKAESKAMSKDKQKAK